jgi:hypothetical protein
VRPYELCWILCILREQAVKRAAIFASFWEMIAAFRFGQKIAADKPARGGN